MILTKSDKYSMIQPTDKAKCDELLADIAEYERLMKLVRIDSARLQALQDLVREDWQEIEAIKSRYGGKPPREAK